MGFQLRNQSRGPSQAVQQGRKPARHEAPASQAEPRLSALLEARSSWRGLEPSSFYFRHGQRLLNLLVLAAVLPLALALGLCIALINGVLFRDPRRIFFVQQ